MTGKSCNGGTHLRPRQLETPTPRGIFQCSVERGDIASVSREPMVFGGMVVKRTSHCPKRNGKGRKVTPLRPASSLNLKARARGRRAPGIVSHGHKQNHRATEILGCGRGCENLLGGHCGESGLGVSHQQDSLTASSGDSSVSMPSGVTSYLLQCLDSDPPDSSLSFIEAFCTEECCGANHMFKRTDGYDVSGSFSEDRVMVKNSTLLDVSQAQNLEIQQPLNLSSILELSSATAKVQTRASVTSLACTTGCEEGASDQTEEKKGSHFLSQCFMKRIQYRKVTFNDNVSVKSVEKKGCAKVLWTPAAPVRFFQFSSQRASEDFFNRLKAPRSFQFPAKPVRSYQSSLVTLPSSVRGFDEINHPEQQRAMTHCC